MGLSAKDSRIFYIPHSCPIKLNGSAPGGGGSGSGGGGKRRFSEQVTRIELTPAVYQRKYGHDKSYGTQDVCSGIKSWDGVVTTKVADGERPFSLTAGDTVWLRVYPIGIACGHPIQGYGVIDSDPITMNLENGEPVEHVYRFSSKGKWKGLPRSNAKWGGYECECNNGASGSGSWSGGYSGGSTSGGGSTSIEGMEVDSATPNATEANVQTPASLPITAYQWTGQAWSKVLDESRGGFVPGPAPTEPGTFAGQLFFVECVVG
jgi:hypothetical protein